MKIFKNLCKKVRNPLSSSVNVMALTATAMKSLRREVCITLGMNDYFLVTISLDHCVLCIIVCMYH